MVAVGDSVVFSSGENEIVCVVDKISKDGQYLLIVDKEGILQTNMQYNLAISRPGGVITGGGSVFKIREAKKSDEALAGFAEVEYIVKIVRPFQKVQKRNAYRHNCYFPITLIEYDSTDKKQKYQHEAHVINISGTGAKILTNAVLTSNSVVDIVMKLGKIRLELLAVVIDTIKNGDYGKLYKNTSRLRFTHMTEKEEEIITRFVFEEFRRERRRQLQQEQKKNNKEQNEQK